MSEKDSSVTTGKNDKYQRVLDAEVIEGPASSTTNKTALADIQHQKQTGINNGRFALLQADSLLPTSSRTWCELTEESGIRSPTRQTLSSYFDASDHHDSHQKFYGSTSCSNRFQASVARTDTTTTVTDGQNVAGPTHHSNPSHSNLSDRPIIARNYYDDFTSIDWVKDYLYDAKQRDQMSSLRGLGGKLKRLYYHSQDWVLIVIISFSCSLLAFIIDKSEELLVDLKRGYCTRSYFLNQQQCCSSYTCASWKLWPEAFSFSKGGLMRADFFVYTILSVLLATLATKVTLTTKYVNPLAFKTDRKAFKTMYHGYGSGVPEVKTVLSGFVIRKFLGSYTLFSKSAALILAIASGLSLGKEGPYVHLATCVGNIVSRHFKKFKSNGIERRVMLSAAAAAGVTLAFGSPLGGVMFSLEEVSYFLPGNQLFKTFFAAIMANLFLRLLDPYGTGKAVLFEAKYASDWQTAELILVITIGAAGGVFGAMFCKFASFWGSWFRAKRHIRDYPVREVILVSLLTAILSFSNSYSNISVAELLANLASPCYSPEDSTGDLGLCPINRVIFPKEVIPLGYALLVKIFLTSITFGLKVPAGIYVPSMVIGALFGRIFATIFEYLAHSYPSAPLFAQICSKASTNGFCIDFGIYAMISAGAFMAGVTRMNVTLAIIIFELTSSYNYVVPISIAIAVSNFTAYMLEPQSLYEMIISKNDFPYLDNHKTRNFGNGEFDVRDIISNTKEPGSDHCVDLTASPYVPCTKLKKMLSSLQSEGLVDGCLPILRNKKLAGIMPAPELELAIDRLNCFVEEFGISESLNVQLLDEETGYGADNSEDSLADTYRYQGIDATHLRDALHAVCDWRDIIEKFPIFLDIDSPLSLIELVFTRMGNRSIPLLDNGEFVGLLHKKS